MATMRRRFQVALSFPGERREYVRAVAEHLAAALGRENVLYDEYLTAELARPDLDMYLATLYREQSELLVPFLCADYKNKKWCNLEWRQMRAIMFALDGARIMPLRFDDTNIPGMLPIDGYLTIGTRSPQETAALILQRLGDGARPASQSSAASAVDSDGETTFWNVPYARNPFFTGRKYTLGAVRSRLTDSGRAALTQALSGMGGIGKTQTAIEYAYLYREDYLAVMWVSADTEITIRTSLVAIAAGLGLQAPDDPDHNRAVEAVKAWCNANRRWLLVFDNADDPRLLKAYLPLRPGGHILLTTRAHVLDSIGITKPVDVFEMPSDEAVAFLFARAGRDAGNEEERAAASVLAAALGGLPLALEQAAAFVMAHDTTFRDYLASYRKRHLDLLAESNPLAGDYPASVATTWSMNFAAVNSASEASGDVLRVSAFLQPEAIPVELFIEGGAELGEAIAAFAVRASDDPVVRDQLLEPLTRHSLIRRDVESLTYTIHRLVQAVVRQSMDNDTRRGWALRVTRALNKIFPSGSFDTWRQCDRLVAHGVAAAALADEFGFTVSDSGNVINGVACYLRMRGDYLEAERIHLQSVRLRERELGENDLDVATALNNLALVYVDRFEFAKAEPFLVRALRIVRQTDGPDSDSLSLALNNLGMCYVRAGRYAEAQPLLEQAIALERTRSPREDFFYATILNNMAELKLGVRELDEALRFCQEGLEYRESIGNPEKLGRSYITMAAVQAHRGEHEAAEEFFVKALRNRESVYGLEHPELLLTLKRYGDWLTSQGRREEGAVIEERLQLVCARYDIPNDLV
jgi:tetratricopeptide (TPR) repeat protein